MGADARRHAPTAWWIRMISRLALLASGGPFLWADDAPIEKLPTDVERLVKWLPEDTETLIVARSITFNPPKWEHMKGWSVYANFLLTNDIDVAGDPLAPLRGREISLAVQGARNFDVVTKFGGLRGEHCTVFSLSNPLEAGGRDLTEHLRRHAASVRSMGGRDVFTFASAILRQHEFKPLPWEGSYFVVLDPKTVLHATSDRYLAEVLARVTKAVPGRALAGSLPEWRHVDLTAPAWVLRHFPPGGRDFGSAGMTASLRDKQLQIEYLPRANVSINLADIEKYCFLAVLDPETRAKCHLVRGPGGRATFTITGALNSEITDFLFQIVMLQGWDEYPSEKRPPG
jgi:hypothetical protein